MPVSCRRTSLHAFQSCEKPDGVGFGGSCLPWTFFCVSGENPRIRRLWGSIPCSREGARSALGHWPRSEHSSLAASGPASVPGFIPILQLWHHMWEKKKKGLRQYFLHHTNDSESL